MPRRTWLCERKRKGARKKKRYWIQPTTIDSKPQLTKSQRRNWRRARKREREREKKRQEEEKRQEWVDKIDDLINQINSIQDLLSADIDEEPFNILELLMHHVYPQMVAFARDPLPFLQALNEKEGSCFKIGNMPNQFSRPHTWAYLGPDQKLSSSKNLDVTFACVWDRKEANAVSWRMARTCVETNFCSFYTALIIYFGGRPSEDQHLASHIADLVVMIARYYTDVALTRPPTRPPTQGAMDFRCTGGYISDSVISKLIG